MIRIPASRRFAPAAWAILLAVGLSWNGAPARADEAPADSTAAKSDEVKGATDEAKEHAAEAKEAGKEKAADAKAKSKSKKEKSKAKKEKAANDANAKGESVTEGAKAAEAKVAPGTMPVKPDVEPQHVQVQHILIGFAGSIPGKGITRTKEEAQKLAYEILARARAGEDFDALVRDYTDDSPPGIYGMSGSGVAPGAGEYSRDGMVPAFGNVGFAISPGNIGIADYDAKSSPYGWHIIKRLK